MTQRILVGIITELDTITTVLGPVLILLRFSAFYLPAFCLALPSAASLCVTKGAGFLPFPLLVRFRILHPRHRPPLYFLLPSWLTFI